MSKHIALAVAQSLALALAPTWATAFDLRLSSSALSNELALELRGVSLVAPLAGGTAATQDVIAAARADYARLVSLLYDRGYFAPVVSILIDGREAASIPPVQPPARIGQVEIRIETGAPFRFGTASITPIAPKTELPEDFATGAPASTTAMQAAVEAGVEGWRNQGHAKAALGGQQIIARHSELKIDADIRLAPGPQLRFGNLNIEGAQAMRPDRIRDIAGLPTGEVFDPDELQRASTRLRRSGVFSVVALNEAENIGPNQTLDVTAQLTEAKPRRLGFGAELSTQEGLALSGYWLHRNLLGGGERLRVGAEISGLGGNTGGQDYTLSLNFGRPATFNEDTDFYLDAEIESVEEPNYTSDSVSLAAGIRRYASEQREYTFGLGLKAANTTDAFGSDSYRIFTIPMSAEFDYRDSELNPKTGYYALASVTPFVGISGTDNGVRLYADARAYRSFGAADGLTFALRGQLGSVAGPSLSDAPADFLFYSGGSGTVRGQEYQSLGVDLGGGNLVGGRAFLAVSGELRVKTTDALSLVGFYDVGYVGAESFPDGSSGVWHSGAGLGLRYDTGIGPVRFDIGVPVSGPGNPSGFQVYIGIGQAF